MDVLSVTLVSAMLLANPAGERKELDELLRQVKERTAATRQKSAELHSRFETEDLGLSGNDNFSVLAPPGDFLARDLLAQAEKLRSQIAKQWLGKELPAGQEFTQIHVELVDDADEGLTLLAGPGRRFRGDNRMWLRTSRELALGSTLAHELTHVVLAAQFPGGMPAWANEGIASLADDADRIARRREILAGFRNTNRWPSVAAALNEPAIEPSNESAYAVAVSLTEFFLARGDRMTFLKFVAEGVGGEWNAVLKRHYRLESVNALQSEWENWVRQERPKE